MATAKKKAGAAKKAVTRQSSVKKQVKAAKPSVKSATKTPAKKTKSVQKPAPVKVTKAKTSAKPAVSKKAVTTKTTIAKQVKSSPSPKASKPGASDHTVVKKTIKSSTSVPVRGVEKVKSLPVSAAKPTKGSPSKDKVGSNSKKPEKPVQVPAAKVKASTPAKAVSGKTKPADQPDPLHTKAQKAMRELEETMDLSKMRPRIQAGSPPPKPLPKKPHTFPKLPEPTNTGGKVKYQLEFEFRSSPKILFTSLSDSSGLAGWFADEVHTKDDLVTFVWEGGESYARLIALHEPQLVRFQWLEDAADGTYFQFEIKEDDITSDIALVITDFAYPGEKDTNIRLWESQVQKLRMLLGSL
jgi:uncharacterized protein YndB with AHSA1/START domain